jgi:hypothetical protein
MQTKAIGSHSWWKTMLPVVLLSGGLFSGICLAIVGMFWFTLSPVITYLVAEYEGMDASLSIDGDRVVDVLVYTNRPGKIQPKVFIREDGGIAIPVAELRKQRVAKLARELHWLESHSPGKSTYDGGSNPSSSFEFLNGKLIQMAISSYNPFEISSKRDGPFVSIPAAKDEFLAVFGKPKKWKRAWEGRQGMP